MSPQIAQLSGDGELVGTEEPCSGEQRRSKERGKGAERGRMSESSATALSRGQFAGARSPPEFDDHLGTTEALRTFLHRQSWKAKASPGSKRCGQGSRHLLSPLKPTLNIF